MSNYIPDNRSMEVREEVVQESAPGGDPTLAAPVDRRERVRVVRDAAGEHQEHVVQDVGAEQRAVVHKVAQLIWLLTGLLELSIGLRILLKLLAANPNNAFAQLVYGFTDLFLWPFQGLLPTPTAGNGMTLELSAFIAMLVYAVAAWVLVKLLYLIFSPASARRVTTYHRDEM